MKHWMHGLYLTLGLSAAPAMACPHAVGARLPVEEVGARLAAHAAWLDDASRGQPANFCNLDLESVNWSGRVLKEVNLEGADLRGAILDGAVLHRARLDGADLRGASLRGALLGKASLKGVNLTGADLREANLRKADASGAGLRGAILDAAYLGKTVLTGAALDDASMAQSKLRKADLERASMRRVDLSGASLEQTRLKGADLTGAKLRGADVSGTSLDLVYLYGADLSDLRGVDPERLAAARSWSVDHRAPEPPGDAATPPDAPEPAAEVQAGAEEAVPPAAAVAAAVSGTNERAPVAVSAEDTTAVPAGAYVQLGAVRDVEAAQQRLARLMSEHEALLGGLRATVWAVPVRGRGVWQRMLAGPLADQAAASSLCTRLGELGVECLVRTIP